MVGFLNPKSDQDDDDDDEDDDDDDEVDRHAILVHHHYPSHVLTHLDPLQHLRVTICG